MRSSRATAALVTVLGWLIVAPPGAVASPRPAPPPDPVATVVARYREQIPQLMAEQGVPGLAVALVDRRRTLWVQGFGTGDGPGSGTVTGDTMFSVQSMSKVFTATAVMQAVAAGRLDLDVPITTYLPGFTVHSAFERHPERRITLRMLLSHTAGFTHEAPVGNNNNLDPGSFGAHVRSISDTWLRFPVGTGYAYSNLGIDLAGYILEQVEGKPFAEILHDQLLGPLGMDRSTFGRSEIRAADNRAVGHVFPYASPPVYEPMTAAGGLYTSASDLARFLHFQLNDGSIHGRVVLPRRWMQEMRVVPRPHQGAATGYALGVARTRWNRYSQRPDLFDHGGGGFGFLSDLWWAPQLGLGIAVLTDSEDHQLQGDLALSILGDLVSEQGPYRDRLLRLPERPQVVDGGSFEPPAGLSDMISKAAMAPDSEQAARWASYSGRYRAPVWGLLAPIGPTARFSVEGGVPYAAIPGDDGTLVRHRLTEIRPGLFLADNGETLDLRGPDPTWANLRIVRVSGPLWWQWVLLLATAGVALLWLVGAAVRAVRRRSARSAARSVAPGGGRHRTAAVVAGLTALVAMATVALVAAVPGLVDSGFVDGFDLPTAWRLVLHLPLALAVLGVATGSFVAAAWWRHWWTRGVMLQYAGVAVAAIALSTQLAAWHLIGWGLI